VQLFHELIDFPKKIEQFYKYLRSYLKVSSIIVHHFLSEPVKDLKRETTMQDFKDDRM